VPDNRHRCQFLPATPRKRKTQPAVRKLGLSPPTIPPKRPRREVVRFNPLEGPNRTGGQFLFKRTMNLIFFERAGCSRSPLIPKASVLGDAER
jgi:hypothetical protein